MAALTVVKIAEAIMTLSRMTPIFEEKNRGLIIVRPFGVPPSR